MPDVSSICVPVPSFPVLPPPPSSPPVSPRGLPGPEWDLDPAPAPTLEVQVTRDPPLSVGGTVRVTYVPRGSPDPWVPVGGGVGWTVGDVHWSSDQGPTPFYRVPNHPFLVVPCPVLPLTSGRPPRTSGTPPRAPQRVGLFTPGLLTPVGGCRTSATDWTSTTPPS